MNRFKKILGVICLLTLSFNTQAASINVAVAANLQVAFADLAHEFQQETGIEVKSSFGSSGKLSTQIQNSAPFDVFLSANMAFPQKLFEQKLTVSAPKIYVYGDLILWAKKGLDLKNWQKTLQSSSVNKIAICNPKTAPYGYAATRTLDYYHLMQNIKPKLVYAESVGQVNQYIYSGVVDIGFTAKSTVFSPKMKNNGQWIDAPKGSYEPIAQGAVIIKSSKNQDAAKSFMQFILGAKAGKIFAKYGYSAPQ